MVLMSVIQFDIVILQKEKAGSSFRLNDRTASGLYYVSLILSNRFFTQ